MVFQTGKSSDVPPKKFLAKTKYSMHRTLSSKFFLINNPMFKTFFQGIVSFKVMMDYIQARPAHNIICQNQKVTVAFFFSLIKMLVHRLPMFLTIFFGLLSY